MSESTHNETGRDAGLTAIYRAAPTVAPPAALDAAILAAARREVSARPRPAGFSFRALRVPLSIAAVLVLSVSLVTLMREEAPELTAPRADVPAAESKLKTDRNADDATARGSVHEEQRPKNLGLKPPQSTTSSGLGVRSSDFAERQPRSNKDAAASKQETDAVPPIAFAKRREASQDGDELRDKKAAGSVERQNNAAESETRRAFSQTPAASAPSKEMAGRSAQPAAPAIGAVVADAPAESKVQVGSAGAAADRLEPAPRLRAQASNAPVRKLAEAPPAFAPNPQQAKPSPQPASALDKLERSADLPPEKWLERIDELRRQGHLDDARASLAEFRKRYPDYRLPDSLRDLAKP